MRTIPGDLAPPLSADGAAMVPVHLAGPVRDLLVTAVWDLAKTNGGTVHADLRRLIEELHQVDQRRDQTPPAGALPSTEARTARCPTVEATVEEAARVMGCSREWVRHLARQGTLPARRLGRIWLIAIKEERTHADSD